jgi:thiamine-monophosphate kinase
MHATITDEAAAVEAVLAITGSANGDDCAVLHVGGASACTSVDSTIAGVHAPLGTDPRALGRRAAARAASDLAAMGAAPLAMTCAVHVPEGRWGDAVAAVEGVAARGREQGLPLVGGDLAATPGPLALVVTVLGRRGAPRAATSGYATRAGARAGDLVVVTGVLGRSAAAAASGAAAPEPPDRLRAGRVLARVAHAMIDVSDGIARDAVALARASGRDLVLDLGSLPCAAGITPELAATHGDDYELLACVPPHAVAALRALLDRIAPALGLTEVGVVVEGGGEARFERDGAAVDLPRGFVHGAAAGSPDLRGHAGSRRAVGGTSLRGGSEEP